MSSIYFEREILKAIKVNNLEVRVAGKGFYTSSMCNFAIISNYCTCSEYSSKVGKTQPMKALKLLIKSYVSVSVSAELHKPKEAFKKTWAENIKRIPCVEFIIMF